MNCYKLILFFVIAFVSIQKKQFVNFKADEVNVSIKGEHLTIVLPFQILDSFHIQSEKIFDNNLIPTEIHFDEPNGYKILNHSFSKVNRETIVLDQLKCEVLSDELKVTILLEKKFNTNQPIELQGNLYYQACDDRQCFYPRNLQFVIKLTH